MLLNALGCLKTNVMYRDLNLVLKRICRNGSTFVMPALTRPYFHCNFFHQKVYEKAYRSVSIVFG